MELSYDLNGLPRFGQVEDGGSKFITKLKQYFLAGVTAKRTHIQFNSPVHKTHPLPQLKNKKAQKRNHTVSGRHI